MALQSDWLILPGDPFFDLTLSTQLPPMATAQEVAFVARAGNGGILEPLSAIEATEYLYGGEYDARLSEIGDDGAEL
jgi:hypothetical protein